ncbi:hypothetical protein [Nocardiopsis dassonvillei]|uniref:hypothetical protein n=1 Tax=Nocardiopsis dassonvillei TaxID=2014 RepID=UPI003F5679B8
MGIHGIASLPRWSRGRVGLLGDAARAMTPSSGQGAPRARKTPWSWPRACATSTTPHRP